MLVAATLGSAAAQSPTTTSSDASNPPDADSPAALPVDSVPGDNSNVSRAQVPGINQTPLNSQPTNIPLFPAQLGNPISPYTSSSTSPQSPQITTPTLYVTGNRDLSQITTNNALTQAFSQGGVGSGFYGDTGVDYEHAPIDRIRLGPFDLKAAVVAGAVGDDNLRTENTTGKSNDVNFTFTPAIMLQYGDHEGQRGYAGLVYAPTISQFYHHSDQNNVNQNVSLNAIYPFQRLTLNLSQTYTQTSGVNQDSNLRTTQSSSNTNVGASYEVDEKLSVSSQVQFVNNSFSDPQGSGSGTGSGTNSGGGQGGTTTSVSNTVSYRLTEKLSLGPGLNVGWDNPSDTAKSTYEQAIVALNYAPTEKIGLFAQGGAEIRQYDDGGGTQVNPIFAVGAAYNPFDSTSLSVSATQSVHTSTAEIGQPTGGQTVVSTGIGASISQRVAQRVYLDFTFNYSHDDDSAISGSAGSGSTPDTSEDDFTYRPSVSFSPTAWTSLALYYQYLSNSSNISGSSYHDNQIGVSVSAQF